MNKLFTFSLFWLLCATGIAAQVKLSPIFSDNMVLQQQIKLIFAQSKLYCVTCFM